jgi:hypothetical protein
MTKVLLDCMRKSIPVCLTVGTILSLINQSEAIFSLTFSAEASIKIFLNYLVPLCVATYSRYKLMKELEIISSPE